MGTIIYDARKIKAYEDIRALGEYAGKEEEYIDELWKGLLFDAELMKEFMYYLDHHALLDEVRCEGYGLTDLYVWNISKYNLYRDLGKNPVECNKEAMVLDSFMSMIEMKKNPEEYCKWLSQDNGMDRF